MTCSQDKASVVPGNKGKVLLHQTLTVHRTASTPLIQRSRGYKVKVLIVRFKVKVVAIFNELLCDFLGRGQRHTWMVEFILLTGTESRQFIDRWNQAVVKIYT
jgi:hypothetical protein